MLTASANRGIMKAEPDFRSNPTTTFSIPMATVILFLFVAFIFSQDVK